MSNLYIAGRDLMKRNASETRRGWNARVLPARPSPLRGFIDAFRQMGPLEQRHQIRDGIKAIIVRQIARDPLNIPVSTLLTSLGLPKSTILRKISKGQRLTSAESDRLARLLYVLGQAADVFEDEALAGKWMLRPNIGVAGLRPLEVLDSQPGYDRVRDLLTSIAFGLPI